MKHKSATLSVNPSRFTGTLGVKIRNNWHNKDVKTLVLGYIAAYNSGMSLTPYTQALKNICK